MAWRKSWSQQNLDPSGTKRQLTPEQRSVWDDVLDLAENCHDHGHLAAFKGVGFTLDQMVEIFNTPEPVVASALAKFKELDMLSLNSSGVLVVKNWVKYQSEYDRVKDWRDHKRKPKR